MANKTSEKIKDLQRQLDAWTEVKRQHETRIEKLESEAKKTATELISLRRTVATLRASKSYAPRYMKLKEQRIRSDELLLFLTNPKEKAYDFINAHVKRYLKQIATAEKLKDPHDMEVEMEPLLRDYLMSRIRWTRSQFKKIVFIGFVIRAGYTIGESERWVYVAVKRRMPPFSIEFKDYLKKLARKWVAKATECDSLDDLQKQWCGAVKSIDEHREAFERIGRWKAHEDLVAANPDKFKDWIGRDDSDDDEAFLSLQRPPSRRKRTVRRRRGKVQEVSKRTIEPEIDIDALHTEVDKEEEEGEGEGEGEDNEGDDTSIDNGRFALKAQKGQKRKHVDRTVVVDLVDDVSETDIEIVHVASSNTNPNKKRRGNNGEAVKEKARVAEKNHAQATSIRATQAEERDQEKENERKREKGKEKEKVRDEEEEEEEEDEEMLDRIEEERQKEEEYMRDDAVDSELDLSMSDDSDENLEDEEEEKEEELTTQVQKRREKERERQQKEEAAERAVREREERAQAKKAQVAKAKQAKAEVAAKKKEEQAKARKAKAELAAKKKEEQAKARKAKAELAAKKKEERTLAPTPPTQRRSTRLKASTEVPAGERGPVNRSKK